MGRSSYKRLGDYIQPVDIRNKERKVETLLGVSNAKVFMPSIANTIGTDMSNYKVITKGQFAYVTVTSRNGDKLSVALMQEEEAIVSQAYTVFEVADKSELLPDYLMMWFRRPEFDRYARFKSHGSAREIFDWEEMCEVRLPIPAIEEQREIVAQYEAITRRIALNERICANLEETAQALYNKMFVQGIDPDNLPDGWRMGAIEEFGEVVTGKTPSSRYPEHFGDYMPFVTPAEFQGEKFIRTAERKLSIEGVKALEKKVIREGDVMVTCIGSDMGKAAISDTEVVTNQQINSIRTYDNTFSEYLYYTLKGMKEILMGLGSGSSTMPLLSKRSFEVVEVPYPPTDLIQCFSQTVKPLSTIIERKSKEKDILREMLFLLILKI